MLSTGVSTIPLVYIHGLIEKILQMKVVFYSRVQRCCRQMEKY